MYDDWQDLIERAEVDVISVATPETLRRAPVTMALERGRHALVEKPFSVELADAQAMVRLAESAGTVTATCFVWRYAPGAQVARREVQAGRIGRILGIQMEWRLRMTPRWVVERWPWSVDVATGSLGACGSHEFDRARYLTQWQVEDSGVSIPRSLTDVACGTSSTRVGLADDDSLVVLVNEAGA